MGSGFFKPLTNITPFTYRDNETYLERLNRLQEWCNETGITLETSVDQLVEQFDAGLLQATVDAANAAASAAAAQEMAETMVSAQDAAVAHILENGPLTKQIVGTPLPATDAELDLLINSLPHGARLYVPLNKTITYYRSHTFTKKVHIDGPGTIVDGRTAPSWPFIALTATAQGSEISATIRGSVPANQYIADHHAIAVYGTDNGPETHPTPFVGLTVNSPTISGFGGLALYAENVVNGKVNIGTVSGMGFGGVIARSVTDFHTHIETMYDIGPGPVGAETYGIQYDRRDANGDLVRYPHSTNSSARIDTLRNAPQINALGTHGGSGLHFEWGSAIGVKRIIDIVASSNSVGARFAPKNVTFNGGVATSSATPGNGQPAIIVAGAFAGDSVVEYASGISGSVGTLVGFGSESDAISGAAYFHSTQGLNVEFSNIINPSPWAVVMYHNNVKFTLKLGNVTDAWTNTLPTSGAMTAADKNTGWVITGQSISAGKVATHVNGRGIAVAQGGNISNEVRVASTVDFRASDVPFTGPVFTENTSAILAPHTVPSVPGYAFEGDPGTGFARIAEGQVGVMGGGNLLFRAGNYGLIFGEDASLDLGAGATGSRIGVAPSRKLGFWGATPVVQPTGTPTNATDLPTTIALLNSIRQSLIQIGLVQ